MLFFVAQLAQVARTPWLDPCVAGVILSVKALSEGDWRLGKGALAGWADKGLRAASDVGAKALRLRSGDEVRDFLATGGEETVFFCILFRKKTRKPNRGG